MNILKSGEQFDKAFLAVRTPTTRSPPSSIPTARTASPWRCSNPGAILTYLADKTGKLLPAGGAERYRVLCSGCSSRSAGSGRCSASSDTSRAMRPSRIPYAIDRYWRETLRLYAVMNEQLEAVGIPRYGDYSVADVATYPWVDVRWFHEIDITELPRTWSAGSTSSASGARR